MERSPDTSKVSTQHEAEPPVEQKQPEKPKPTEWETFLKSAKTIVTLIVKLLAILEAVEEARKAYKKLKQD